MNLKIWYLLGIFTFLAACSNEVVDDRNIGRDPTHNDISIRFVDEQGNWLVERLSTDLPEEKQSRWFSPARYTLRRWDNGIEMPQIEDDLANFNVTIFPQDGSLTFRCGFGHEPNYREIDHVFKLVFSCPELYGDDSEHTFIVVKKGRNLGIENNAELILYDDRIIASKVKGGSNRDGIPFVVTVPIK